MEESKRKKKNNIRKKIRSKKKNMEETIGTFFWNRTGKEKNPCKIKKI